MVIFIFFVVFDGEVLIYIKNVMKSKVERLRFFVDMELKFIVVMVVMV